MKAVMAGQRVSLRSKIESGLAIYNVHRRGLASNARDEVTYHRKLIGHLQRYTGKSVDGARILDLGCGQTATQTALFHADGAVVTGIDVEVPTFSLGVATFIRTLRLNGPERALKSLARHVLFDQRFFRALSAGYDKSVSFKNLDVRIMDATAMEFADSTFDFVTSLSVFEHISDVRGAVRELNRVLKPGGIAVITPHLFGSLSGGHCLEWVDPDRQAAANVAPWDHLRENQHPAAAYMNRVKLHEYRQYFRESLDVVDEVVSTEGERYLTPELEAELGAKGYTREDLLTRIVTFFARKKSEH
jgi:ubiquinone/menaquinone biosynthesis C-methylase UbiE